MKESTLVTRMHLLANKARNILEDDDRRSGRKRSGVGIERPARKEFFFYQPVIDQDTQQLLGHMSDISPGGFKLDSQHPILEDMDFHLGLSLTGEVADKPSMSFIARSRWCRVDPLDPFLYNVGFQLVHIAPFDLEIFNRMMEKYGREHKKGFVDLRRSNKW